MMIFLGRNLRPQRLEEAVELICQMFFTEYGVLMLSSILNSQKAMQVNIQIVRIFTRLRQWLTENGELKYEIEDIKRKLNNQDKNIELVFSYLDQLMEKKNEPRKRIGFMPDDL